MTRTPDGNQADIIVIGAGIGGLAATLRMAAAGRDVLVLERAAEPGGKLRAVPSAAGPVDAGPTVMTLIPVFERLFADAGLRLADHVNIRREPLLARHWWTDGGSLDLFTDREASARAVHELSGPAGAREFRSFTDRMRRLFRAFEAPVMQARRPSLPGIMGACLRNPGLMPLLLPGRTMAGMLDTAFTDPRLRQLFGRYATYVGGSPFQSPALLSLIWHAEEQGIGLVQGGMHRLAKAIQAAATAKGARFVFGTGVARIERTAKGFTLTDDRGRVHSARRVLFNGDPRALAQGLLGPAMTRATRSHGTEPRSLSAWVWSFAAQPSGADLAHHNVFFNADYRREFNAIAEGRMPRDAALYVCAQDRHSGVATHGLERFEIILNGAPVAEDVPRPPQEYPTCLMHTFDTLAARGLRFDPLPKPQALTTPHGFAERFPGSAGSLYGRSPHGMMASFLRPTVRSRIPGLYLAGGGVHPGAGIPMAATSGRLAAEAILTDLASTSTSRRTAMRGGMSMDFPTTAPTASRSSGS